MSKISETIGIEVNEGGIIFKAQSDMDKGEVYFKQNDVEEKEIAIELREDISCSFAVRYLNMFNKYSQFSQTVTISMGQGTHVVIT